MGHVRNRSGKEGNLVHVRPFLRLAREGSVEGVLESLAAVGAEKGIELCSARILRGKQDREFVIADSVDVNIEDLDISVEGGRTRLILQFRESADAARKREMEEAAYLAAHRIELLAGRKGFEELAGQGREVDPVIDGLVGNSRLIRQLKKRILVAAACNSTVLISGESGTGKEIAARAIHNLSPRGRGPFIPVNCGAFTESLLESELFGYVKGAFTGAVTNRAGLFEAAAGGTIFLDEVGEMTPAMQVRLLRVLQEHRIRPVGAHRELEIDARVIAATNRDLFREIAERRFRHDLYYRLHVLSVETPSLRDHPTDLPLLIHFLLEPISRRLGFQFPFQMEPEAIDRLCQYAWPGNVRELEGMLERLAAESGDGGLITEAQVGEEISKENAADSDDIEYRAVLRANESLDEHLQRQELALYQTIRDRFGRNHSEVAHRLGVGRTALYHRLERAKRWRRG